MDSAGNRNSGLLVFNGGQYIIYISNLMMGGAGGEPCTIQVSIRDLYE